MPDPTDRPPDQGAPPEPDVCLILRPLADPERVPAAVRLRRLIKAALRTFKFRLLDAAELKPAEGGRRAAGRGDPK